MKIDDFCIGNEFYCGKKRWRCTDIGTRVIVAICISEHDNEVSWLNGPPYAIVEHVFDEDDQLGCSLEFTE